MAGHHTPASTLRHSHGLNALGYRSNLVNLYCKADTEFLSGQRNWQIKIKYLNHTDLEEKSIAGLLGNGLRNPLHARVK